ncbi:hypothetical protein H5410_057749 [Solanum commersonii]|uniref:Uncharacterized protein n=1 Tax=Solanum commersonii TaxID=4109 RepID=A0A9J5WQX1_SOLCO|nr:hypothetical protein H5410_057749 [Solanum commersonii]
MNSNSNKKKSPQTMSGDQGWLVNKNFVLRQRKRKKRERDGEGKGETRFSKAYEELPENTRLNEGIANLDEEDENVADVYIEFENENINKI